MHSATAAYWRLSAVYFFFFALLGVQAPYWAPYLASIGFSPVEIGQLLAIFMVARIAAPLIWQVGWFGQLSVLQRVWLANTLTLGCFIGVFFGSSFAWLALVLALFGFCWNAVLPLYEAFTLAWLDQDSHRYSRIRLWGSLGFVVAVLLVGSLLDRFGLSAVPWVMLALIILLWGSGLLLPKPKQATPALLNHDLSWREFVTPDLVVFFGISGLMQVVHGPYYSFYSIHLAELGYSGAAIGAFWALGVVAEVAFFWMAPVLLPRISVQRLLQGALLLAVLRWGLIGFSDELSLLLFAQLLHAATYGCFHVAAMEFIHRRFDSARAVRAQAIYGGLSFGGGSALGALAAGYLWSAGGAPWSFGLAALLSVVTLAWLSRMPLLR